MKCIVIESEYLGYVRPFSLRGYKPYQVDLEAMKEKEALEYKEYLESVKAAEFKADPFLKKRQEVELMNRLERLQYERSFVNDTLKEIDRKIRAEKLSIALETMNNDPELMKALKINTGGK